MRFRPGWLKQCAELLRRRRSHFAGDGDDAVDAGDRIVPDPAPTHGLGEGGVQHDVHAGQRAWRQRPAANSAPTAEHGVGGVNHRRGDVADWDVPQVRTEIAVEHRAGLANCRRCPAGGADGEPGFQQLAHPGTNSDGAYRLHGREHLGELALGVGAGAANSSGAIQTTARIRVGSDVDAQFPRAGASLT